MITSTALFQAGGFGPCLFFYRAFPPLPQHETSRRRFTLVVPGAVPKRDPGQTEFYKLATNCDLDHEIFVSKLFLMN
jgi:hypothetical protein